MFATCSFWTLAIVCSIVKDFFIWIHLDLIMLSSLVFKLHHTQPTNHTHLNIFEIIWKYWRLFFVFHFVNLTQNWKCDIILESFSNSIKKLMITDLYLFPSFRFLYHFRVPNTVPNETMNVIAPQTIAIATFPRLEVDH